jgi:hypothetical protein
MTDDELTKLAADAATEPPNGDPWARDVVRLVAEVMRLRGLIKQAEWFSGIGYHDNESGCPWCEADGYGKHNPNCPAFDIDGTVR